MLFLYPVSKTTDPSALFTGIPQQTGSVGSPIVNAHEEGRKLSGPLDCETFCCF